MTEFMNFEKLSEIILEKISLKLQNHKGLKVFAIERAKFEGWLKVEICEILLGYYRDVIPEKNRVDISFSDWGIELKTLNTNIRYKDVKNKIRPITNNTDSVIIDINKLKNLDYKNKAVLFIVFPITPEDKNWNIQLDRIKPLLSQLKERKFNFNNSNISGVIYFGLI